MGFLIPLVGAGLSFLASTGVGATLFKAAVGIGLNLAIGALSKKKQKRDSQPAPQGVQFELQTGSSTPRSVAMGRCAARGQRAWFKETGGNNENFNFIDILSDGRCQGLVGVLVDGVYKGLVSQTVTGSEHARYHVQGYGSLIVLRWHDGRAGQTADTDMVAVSGGEITANDVGDGLAYVAGTIAYDAETFQSLPELLFVFDGYRLYDPRKDDLVGGSGTHRFADPATWEFAENPALQTYNYASGISAGSDSMALGGFALTSGLDTATFMVAANACDEDVALSGGGSEGRYRCSAIIEADGSDHRSKIAGLLQAMAGWPVDRGGRLGVLAGTAQTPVVTFTDDDLTSDAEVEWSRIRTRDERVNQVRGQFISEEAGWDLDDYPALSVSSDLTEDGELLEASFDLPTVRSETQAQRIASIRQRESRYGDARVTLLRPFILLDAGDWVRWDSATYGNHVYRVEAIAENDGLIPIDLRRVDSGIYDEPSFGVYTPPAPFTGPPAFATTVSGFTVQAGTEQGQTEMAIVQLSWNPITDDRVDAVIIQYREAGTTVAEPLRDDSPGDGFATVRGLTPGLDYEFRASIATTPARFVEWTPWVSITTSAVSLAVPDSSVTLAKLDQDVQGLFAAINRLREDGLTQKDIIDDLLATSQSVDLLERFLADRDTRAFVASESLVRTTEEESLASLITTVSTTLNGNTADISWVQASQNGQAVRFGILGNINGQTGGFQFQGIQLDGEVSYIFEIDGDLIVDGSITADKLQANELSALTANLGLVTAGRLESPDGQTFFDLDNKLLVIA